MLVTPQLEYPTSAPIALGGTTDAVQLTAARGQISARVTAGSTTIQVLRWLVGVAGWERMVRAGQPVTIIPSDVNPDGVDAAEFDAGTAYYTALLTTPPPEGTLVALAGVDISNAAAAGGGGGGSGVTTVTASGDLKTTGLPTAPNIETLFSQPLSGEVYVNFSAPNGGIGSQLSPWNDLAPAVALVAASSIGSLTRIWITLGNAPNGHESDAHIWAPGRLAILDCPVRTYPILGEMTLLGGDGNTTALLCRNATVARLIYQDMPGIASPGVIISVGENGTIDAGGVEQRDEFGAPGGTCLTLTQWAGYNNVGLESGGVLNTASIVGSVGCTVLKADNVRFANPAATARLELTQCAMDASPLLLADKGEHNLESCSFLASPFEIRADAGGQIVNVKMDLKSWYNWLEADGFTSAAAVGDGVNVYQHEFATNCGFEITPSFPADLGKIYRQSPTTPRVMLLAVGDSPGNATGITGAWQGDEDSVMPLTGPTMWLRLAAGLTLAGADPLYLDTVSSCATNVPTPYPLGLVVWDSLGYAGVEAVCLAACSPAGAGVIPGPILPLVGPPVAPPSDDWDFGLNSLAETDARFGVSGLMTISGTTPERGEDWIAAGELRWRLLNGSLMLQVSGDGSLYQVGQRAMLNAALPGSVLCVGSMDMSETVNPGGNGFLLYWTQTSAGAVDPNNLVFFQVAQSAVGLNLASIAVEAGVPTVLFNETYTNAVQDVGAVAIAIDGASNLTIWVGSSPAAMRRCSVPYVTTLVPDRQALVYTSAGSPTTTFKLTALRWQPFPSY